MKINTLITLAQAAAPGTSPLDAAANAAQAVAAPPSGSMLDIFHGYIGVFIVAFLVTLFITPVMRRLAVANGVIDRPNEARKIHRIPIAYLGGLAVYIGMMAAIAFSYVGSSFILFGHPVELMGLHLSQFEQAPVAWSILLGMTVIMLTGLIDDVASISPRVKIGGQLLAAAALAYQDIGTKVAAGILEPIGGLIGNTALSWTIPLPVTVPMLGSTVELDLIYWTGVAIIAIFVLGACNASNLIDGLDGLLSGVTAIAATGLLVIALGLALADDGVHDSSRIILALAVLGACMGFLPHNFNPATIFQGDAGSLLLGYTTIVLVLSLGDTGKTHLVVAGLIIYSIPIIDTVLAIVRRKMSGKPFHSADDQHLHHMLKRALGVKGAVFTLYGIGILFATLGVWLSTGRVRVVFTIAMVVWAFIGVSAVKVARRQAIESHALDATLPPPAPAPRPVPKVPVREPEPTAAR